MAAVAEDSVAGRAAASSSSPKARHRCSSLSKGSGCGAVAAGSPASGRGDGGGCGAIGAEDVAQDSSSDEAKLPDPTASSLYDFTDEARPELFGTSPKGVTKFRKQSEQGLQQRAQSLVWELRRRQVLFQSKQQTLARSVNRELKQQWLVQQERLVTRSREMTARLQTGRSRAWRHKWIFALVQGDIVASAFWLGKSPETYHLYYSVQIVLVLACRVFDFVLQAQHYFLLDFCYYANLCIMNWIWFYPTSGTAFNAAEGACGLLAISVVVFRNSCVPHDFVRISNAYVHIPAVVTMLSLKMKCEGALCEGMRAGEAMPWQLRFKGAWLAYMLWAVVYASIIFLVCKQRIERKERDTLYKYMTIQLGYRDKLPKFLRMYSESVFMLGHQALFLVGFWWLLLPFWGQAFVTVLMLMAFFHNGGRFYVDHFWKAYANNTQQYVDAVEIALAEARPQSSSAAAVPSVAGAKACPAAREECR